MSYLIRRSGSDQLMGEMSFVGGVLYLQKYRGLVVCTISSPEGSNLVVGTVFLRVVTEDAHVGYSRRVRVG